MIKKAVTSFLCISILLISCKSRYISKITSNSGDGSSACGNSLIVSSWNTKHLGRDNFDYNSASELIRNYDIIALQEVNTTESGAKALNRLKLFLQQKTGELWCSALSLIPTDSIRERYAYLWKDSRLSWVNRSGKVVLRCPTNHMTSKLVEFNQSKIVREPSIATFIVKGSRYKFKLASVHLVPTKKKPQKEVPYLFAAFNPSKVPIIVAGDFNLSADHKAFDSIKKQGWINALSGRQRTSLRSKTRTLYQPYDNFWIWDRNYYATRCSRKIGVKDLYTFFPKLPTKSVYNQISDHSPIFLQVFYSKSSELDITTDSSAPQLLNQPIKPLDAINCGSGLCTLRVDKKNRNYCTCRGKRGRAKRQCCL